MNKRHLVVFLILVVAFVFRFQHLLSTPPGLYPDEAVNGVNAQQALASGEFKIFYPENNGREGLFINLQALAVKIFGSEPWVLRLVSGVFGVLTVLGVYLLASQLFSWQIGALSSFMLAISFWHTLFSRIGFRAIAAPFFMVWGLYFLWRGLAGKNLFNFAVSGLFWGLGFHTYTAFRIMPLVLMPTLLIFWQAIRKHFDHEKYTHSRDRLARGLAGFAVTFILAILPLIYYFYFHPADFLGRTGQVSVFASEQPVFGIIRNSITSLAIFNFRGDFNWRHNLAGEPLLFAPIGVLFAFGLIRSVIKLFRGRKTHGHLTTIQAMLLAWFVIGLLPAILSNEGLPHALRSIMVAPVVFIFAGEGAWWVFKKAQERQQAFAGALAIILLLAASAIFEYRKYFNHWAGRPEVADAFAQNYTDVARTLQQLPREMKKYVVVNTGGVEINGLSVAAQPVMFLTDTATAEKQKAKNIFYLTEAQYRGRQYDRAGLVIKLQP